jgi:CDP-glucose 4,6-dehydratase
MQNLSIEELKEFYQGRSVLVTGHTGFKGSWLCRILTLAGAQVTGYALKPPTDPSLFAAAGLEETMNSAEGDIRSMEDLLAVFKLAQPEIVFHLAAQPIVRDSYKDPLYTYETNVMGTVHVLECIRRTDLIRFDRYTSGYNWQWKANTRDGADVDSRFRFLAIPEAEYSVNPGTQTINNELGF